MGDITIHEVVTRGDLKAFINLPAKIHRDDPHWLPPIYMDEWDLFDRKKNNSFAYADTIMLLARRDGKNVGRIMGIISHRYNDYRDEKDGRFCFIESENDPEVVNTMIDAIATWAKGKGMVSLVGPLGFSDKDPQGLQVEGFEYHSIITTPTNCQCLPEIIEKAGFEKKVDLVNYLVDIPRTLPPLFEKVLPRIKNNGGMELLEFRKTKELKPFIIGVLQLMNDTFTEIYGFVPLTDREKSELAKRYLPILDPEFIKIVRNQGKLVAFAIGMPDISEGIKKSGGRLFPFGILKILKSARKTKNLIMLLGGILKDYRGQGLDVLMGSAILQSAMRKEMKTIDSHLVLETNTRMRAEYERMGGRIIRRFRIYRKPVKT
jgi:ribosomal protein S18 acetylase RimI-like enzyme